MADGDKGRSYGVGTQLRFDAGSLGLMRAGALHEIVHITICSRFGSADYDLTQGEAQELRDFLHDWLADRKASARKWQLASTLGVCCTDLLAEGQRDSATVFPVLICSCGNVFEFDAVAHSYRLGK